MSFRVTYVLVTSATLYESVNYLTGVEVPLKSKDVYVEYRLVYK